MIKVIEKCDRKQLGEGRSSGMGFAFLQKVDDETYHTVQPLSPCKDYLNEVVYTENTGYASKACGIDRSKKTGLYSNKLYFYMAIKIVPSQYGGGYFYGPTQKADEELLVKNHKNIEKLLNHFEKELGMTGRSVVDQAEDGYFVLTSPVGWTVSTIAISLYSLLVRCSLVYHGISDPMEFLEGYMYNHMDVGLIRPAVPKLKYMIQQKELPSQPVVGSKDYDYCPHNCGILGSWNIPQEKPVEEKQVSKKAIVA